VAAAEATAGAVPGLPVADSALGRRALPVAAGLWGDRVSGRHPALAIAMSLRAGGMDVAPEPAHLALAYPAARGHLVVFLHGLMESDEAWVPARTQAGEGSSFAAALERDLSVSALHVRYDSGNNVSANGLALAGLLEALMVAWPVPVDRIDLVGHSMGGLVARSACHAGTDDGHAWVPRLTTLVTLGTPHLGAPLAKAAHVAGWAMAQVPETEPYSRVLSARSDGIRDLRYGAVLPQDWSGRDPSALVEDLPADLALPAHVRTCHVAATVTKDPHHPVGRVLGDGMVRPDSAAGRGRSRRIPFDPADGARVGGVDHLALLRDPEVYALLHGWIGSGAPASEPST
jgi:pimeloyl-ACP methyl ester carboxylesterase